MTKKYILSPTRDWGYGRTAADSDFMKCDFFCRTKE
jgi:hypothetical protein